MIKRIPIGLLLGLLCLPGFWIEARDPVLEMPITLAFAASMLSAPPTVVVLAIVAANLFTGRHVHSIIRRFIAMGAIYSNCAQV